MTHPNSSYAPTSLAQTPRYAVTLADLHMRYRAVALVRPTYALAREIGVSALTLMRFVRGGYVTLDTLRRIAAWTMAQERRSAAPTLTLPEGDADAL